MRYVGSKRRIAKSLLSIMLNGRKSDQIFYDVCCGGGSIISLVDNPRVGIDSNKYVIAALELIRDNPTSLPKDCADNAAQIQSKQLEGAQFVCASYDDVSYFVDSIIYVDPPYQNTLQYQHSIKDYFWDWVRRFSKDCYVYVSEYKAPDDFEIIWEKKIVNKLSKNQNKIGVERLFRYKYGKRN